MNSSLLKCAALMIGLGMSAGSAYAADTTNYFWHTTDGSATHSKEQVGADLRINLEQLGNSSATGRQAATPNTNLVQTGTSHRLTAKQLAAYGNSNLIVKQAGTDNTATTIMQGAAGVTNQLELEQNGTSNRAHIQQGPGGQAFGKQLGDFNRLIIRQNNGGFASISQIGNNNVADINQTGSGGSANISQQ